MATQDQFGRKASLLVIRPEQQGNNPSAFVPGSVIDLSQMHFSFRTAQQDVESPNNCVIRVYNLADETVSAITKFEYSRVVLQAGYEGVGVGVIFDGTIKQFRVGRDSAVDTYLEILAADGDVAYNFSTVGITMAANSTPKQRVDAIITEMAKKGVTQGETMSYTGGILPRGKVLFGMARALLRQEVTSQGATWNIDAGKINITPLSGYRPGEAIVLTAATGLVGIPEQTNEGIRAKCLLNPRLIVGGRVQIDNRSINQLIQLNPDPTGAGQAFNQYTGITRLAHVNTDGFYRVLVVEHEGDTRGPIWHSQLTGLSLNPVTQQVKAYG